MDKWLRSELRSDLRAIQRDFSPLWVVRRLVESLLALGILVRTWVHFFAYLIFVPNAHHEDLDWSYDLRLSPGVIDTTRPIAARVDALLRLSACAYVSVPTVRYLHTARPEWASPLLLGYVVANVAVPLLDPLVGAVHYARLRSRYRARSDRDRNLLQEILDTVFAPGIFYRTTAHVLVYCAHKPDHDLTDDDVHYHFGHRPISATTDAGPQATMALWTMFAAVAAAALVYPVTDVSRVPVAVLLYGGANWVVLLADPLWFGVGRIKDQLSIPQASFAD